MEILPQEGAIGTYIRYQVLDENNEPRDVSGAIVKQLKFARPNKTTLTVNADFFTNGQDGVLQYITAAASDLTPYGRYEVQAILNMPGFNGKTEVRTFPVGRNL